VDRRRLLAGIALTAEIRRLTGADAHAFQTLRLGGLRESPTSFASSYEEECDLPVTAVAERIANNLILGAFDAGELVGCIGLQRESHHKRAHKAFIWGMYVAPGHRSQGIGRRLLAETLQLAETMPGLRQVILAVHSANAAAVALYEEFGFKPFGVEPDALLIDGRLQDDLHMVRFLAPGVSAAPEPAARR
jgi:RimJ/RimL family protein N-acetyltransferase